MLCGGGGGGGRVRSAEWGVGAGGRWVGAGDTQRISARLRGGADANAERTDFGVKMRRLMQHLSSGPAGRAVKN